MIPAEILLSGSTILGRYSPYLKCACSRHHQPSSLSEPEVVTDSEAVSESNTEYSAEGPMSDTDYDPRHRDNSRYRNTHEPAAEKIATVCNEIKQRFQTDPVTTDDENVI